MYVITAFLLVAFAAWIGLGVYKDYMDYKDFMKKKKSIKK